MSARSPTCRGRRFFLFEFTPLRLAFWRRTRLYLARLSFCLNMSFRHGARLSKKESRRSFRAPSKKRRETDFEKAPGRRVLPGERRGPRPDQFLKRFSSGRRAANPPAGCEGRSEVAESDCPRHEPDRISRVRVSAQTLEDEYHRRPDAPGGPWTEIPGESFSTLPRGGILLSYGRAAGGAERA